MRPYTPFISADSSRRRDDWRRSSGLRRAVMPLATSRTTLPPGRRFSISCCAPSRVAQPTGQRRRRCQGFRRSYSTDGPFAASSTPDDCLDQPVRLFGRNEDLVWVVELKWSQVNEQVVFVGKCERDRIDLGTSLEHCLPHRIRRVLDASTLMLGERLQQRLTSTGTTF